MQYQYTLHLKAFNSNTEVICCKEVGLEIEVDINPGINKKPGDLTLVMQWAKDCAHFTIVERENTRWMRSLFQDAICWYVAKHLQKEPTAFNWSSRMLQACWIDEEDGFEQMEPESEEDRAFRSHIGNEQRKYDVSLKVEAMMYRNSFYNKK
jgi:hypothetical protein